ncbi:ABC transporter ATP-binding protein [Clostridium sardiniense]|uniref:ABC transporter ATP-binding protein n=1 Tax=Clostridium sardiniense TaxID=29369 RepID=UPI00195BD2DE|nr:ABC transporter ATP-binding protein [Clostridium sardiniense]MBM7834417.1 ATP-binding cassette subfamily B protein [Clostridium sardiniense]
MINNKKDRSISIFKILKKITPMVLKAAPIYFIFIILVNIIHAAFWVLNTVASQKFFDSVAALTVGENTMAKTILMALMLGGVLIGAQMLNGISNFMGSSWWSKVAGYITSIVNNKVGNTDSISFEDTNVLDDINKVHEGVRNSIGLIGVITMIACMYIPYFLFMGIYLYNLKPILAVALIFIFIPVALTQFIRIKVFSKLEDEVAPIRREYKYYEECIGSREYFKETRILGAFGYFKNLYLDSLKLLNKKVWCAEKKIRSMELGMKVLTLLGYIGVLYLLFICLINGDISVGAFGAVFSSIGMLFSIMEEVICRHIGEVTQNLGTVRNFIRFLELPERKGEEVEIKDVPDIKLDNVSFAYPSSNKLSIENINLHIKSGETIAIVGENGAGKTTLVKLMIGLYLPTEGDILVDGFNTKEVSQKSLYKEVSAVFQRYQRYKMTFGENISISNIEYVDDYNVDKDIALKKADLTMNKEIFKDGYDTMLSREFNGVDLSGGQWQRVAIARGFYSNHNMIVLDEPTAAIDPVEESKIYNKFKEMSYGNTAIIVTHRLGSAKIADRIVVMDNGKIVECGTHEELINKEGKYREMYNAQSKWYVKSEDEEIMAF